MRVQLYIGNNEVEFSAPPEILYTYQKDDLTNPTIVKNSFSKTITIEGTPSNNQIFGHFWNVQRLQDTSGEGNGVYFNASRKVPFTLYCDSEIYEEGYVKLDSVVSNGGNILYSISLYGGLGSFFYNLSITEDGNERKLSDLDYGYDLGFTANIHTIKEAWDALKNGEEGKWQTINFMTAYNGFPEDFDTDKILINTTGTALKKNVDEGGKIYTTKDGFVLGELPSEMTEWEVRDLRSYLQRPCIRMKKIVEACCNPKNNGGYDVVLDEDFFNEENPYWEDTWLTLPMIQKLEYTNEEQILDGATLVPQTMDGAVGSYMYLPLEFTLGEWSQSIPSSIRVNGKVTIKNGYPYTSFVWYWNKRGSSYHSGHACYGSLFVQLIAKNGDVVVGASEAYNLTSPNRHDGELRFGHNGRYENEHKYNPYLGKPIYDELGWNKNGYWCYEDSTTPIELSFSIYNLNSNVTDLELVYFWGSSKDKRKKDDVNGFYADPWDSGWATFSRSFSTSGIDNLGFEITYSNVKAVMGESMGRTGTAVDKNLLLDTEHTPADFLLSFTKMFGLYYSKDVESNTIYIETRKTFYDRSEVIDLSDLIDRGKDITITPLTFDTKWYQFSQEADETAFYETYLQTRGVEYGSKVLNTGYEFIAEKKQLLEDSAIKSGIEGLERSKYFSAFNNDNVVRTYFGLGMTYSLYNRDDKIEITPTTTNAGTYYQLNEDEGMKYYDIFPKLQFHDGDNDSTDGNNVLVFFSGFKNVVEDRVIPLSYYLSDDTMYQTALNEGTPCWLFTSSEYADDIRIAYKMDELPVFERYLTKDTSTSVIKSLDFGSPQELFIPNYSITEETNIYYNFWKTYLEDLYDINTRKLTCYVRIIGKPNPSWLRRFYWFDGAIWRLNKIVDWNISGLDTTKMEFVKVQEIGSYTSITQKPLSDIKLILTDRNIKFDGAKLDFSISASGNWRIISSSTDLNFSSTTGTGDTNLSVTIPQNTTGSIRPFYITAIDDNGQTSKVYLSQDYENSTFVDVAPDDMIVGAGEYDVDFVWFNQGNNYINSYSVYGEGDVTSDVVGLELDNKASIFVGENNTDGILSSVITFTSGLYEDSIGIDILPKSLNFSKDGESIDLIFNHSTPVFVEVPYWINIENNGLAYTLTAQPNLYQAPQTGKIVVKSQNSAFTGEISVYQEVGGITLPKVSEVSPKSLYFNVEGGTQFLNINIPNTWLITEELDWITTSQRNGDSLSIVSVTATANEGNTRSGVLVVKDVLTGVETNIHISQVGSTTTRTFTIEPTTIEAPSEGGEYDVTITYTGRNGDYVGVEGTGLTLSDLTWVGDMATLKVGVPENLTTEGKTYGISFTTSIGVHTLTITQEGIGASLIVDKKSVSFDSDGGNETIRVTSNISWKTTASHDWLWTEPTTGEVGNTDMKVVTAENTTLEDRVGYIYIDTIETNERMATITITQSKLVEELLISPSSITFDAIGGTASFTITSNTSWTIEENI